ncbi:MAG: TRAP transporter large permease [Clostridiales Family XIII bacterium]|jgi:tripartite ATP-independent transporter DctM subunit|nr:TRAP transporter large permease [Clostridiales Family XIII bacterium]
MSLVTIGILGLIAFLILMVLGLPIPFSMLFSGVVFFAIIKGPQATIQMMSADLLNQFASYTMTVGPLFGFMGFVANYSGIGASLFKTLNSYVGHWKGGLAMATQAACALFGAICGSVPATLGTMSAIAYPEMRKRGYQPELAGSNIAAGATLSVLIPPGTGFIIYGLATDTSIGKLFIGGVLPAILLLVLNCLAILYMVLRNPKLAPLSPKAPLKERLNNLLHGGIIEVAVVFIISMGGMFAGFFTPTEAGAVGAFGMLVVVIATRKLHWQMFKTSLMAGVRLQAMVFALLSCATVFGRFIAVSTIPASVGNFVKSLDLPVWAIMAVIILIYFIMGMFTDLLSMTLITMPIFFPIVCGYLGFDPVWFGVFIVIMTGVGGISPPVGNGVFMVAGMTRWDKATNVAILFKGIVPFMVAAVAAIAIMVAFPVICTLLPTLVYG